MYRRSLILRRLFMATTTVALVFALTPLAIITPTTGFTVPSAYAASYPVAEDFTYAMDYWKVIRGGGEFANVRGDNVYHLGVDTVGNAGDAVYSIGNGIVKHIGIHSRFGTLVLIEHTTTDGGRFVSQYGHLRTTDNMPAVGEVVSKGQYIGELGEEGEENGYWPEHLHFGIRPGAFVPLAQGWVYWGMGNSDVLKEWIDGDIFITENLSPDADPNRLAKFVVVPAVKSSVSLQSYALQAATGTARELEDASFLGFSKSEEIGADIAVGDVTGDGEKELIVGAGSGAAPTVRIFDRQRKTLLGEFLAYADSFKGGVRVASADLNGDGKDEIITGTGVGGGPHVRVFSGTEGTVLFGRIFPFDPSLRTGVDVAAGNVDNDAQPEIIVATGAGTQTQVRILSHTAQLVQTPPATQEAGVATTYPTERPVSEDPETTPEDRDTALTITPYGAFTGGARVAVGDIDADGIGELLIGAGPGGGPHLRVFESDGTPRGIQFFPFHKDFRGGIDVASVDWNEDGKDDLIVSQTSKGQAWVKVYRYNDAHTILAEFNAFGDPEVGANVAGF